jgi:hypothetical protein
MIDDFDLRAEKVILTKEAWLEDVVLPDPRLMGYQEVLAILRDRIFDGLHDKKISIYSIETIHNLWRAAYDLPEINAAIRLTYVVDHYEEALEYDLRNHLGVDLEELWLHRRWGRLLGYIDRLPSHTWYAQAVSEDPEHVALLAKQLAEAEFSGESKAEASPALSTWSPEVAKLTDIHDALKELAHLTASIHAERKVPEPVFAPRPQSDLKRQVDKMKFEHRKAKHEKLVARMLPNR